MSKIYSCFFIFVYSVICLFSVFFFFCSCRRRHTRCGRDWSQTCALPIFRRRAYISWVGLRGAVPIVFATYPLIAGIEKAEMIFNIVFFISVTSIIIQGTSLPWVAKLLHVSLPVTAKPKKALDVFLSDEAKTALEEIIITDGCPMVDKMIVDLDFPDTAIIAMIKRGEQFITPSGSTILKGGDQLMVLSDTKEGIQKVYDSLGIKRVA